MEGINYVSLLLGKREQLGSETKVNYKDTVKNFDYTDGLSVEELKKIDKNQDGVITEAEFKAAFGGKKETTYKESWETYKNYYSSTTEKTQDGYKSVQLNDDGRLITSYYDKNGKMTKYTETINTTNGQKIVVTYKSVNGKETAQVLKQTMPDGSKNIEDYRSESTTRIAVDGTKVTIDKKGNIKEVTTGDGKETYKFSYTKDGAITAASINDQVYKNCSKKNGTITIKDDTGNIIAKISEEKNSGYRVTEYNNGKKAKSVVIDKDGKATEIRTYNNEGKLKTKQLCEYNQLRKYQYDDETGKLSSSTDYRDGKKYSTQTYSNKTGKDVYGDTNDCGRLWASRTFYDENGNITNYREFSHKKDGDNIVKTTTIYEADKKTKKKTIKETKDIYGNTISKDAYNHNTKNTTTTTYNYGSEELTEKKSKENLKTATITTNNKTTVQTYDQGMVMNKEVTTIVDGKAKTSTYDYIYHTNGKVLRIDKKNEETGNTTTTCYDINGNKESQAVEDAKGKRISFKNSIYNILDKKYPDLSDAQIKQLCEKCLSINNIGETDLIPFNYDTNDYEISIPEYEIINGELIFK